VGTFGRAFGPLSDTQTHRSVPADLLYGRPIAAIVEGAHLVIFTETVIP